MRHPGRSADQPAGGSRSAAPGVQRLGSQENLPLRASVSSWASGRVWSLRRLRSFLCERSFHLGQALLQSAAHLALWPSEGAVFFHHLTEQKLRLRLGKVR